LEIFIRLNLSKGFLETAETVLDYSIEKKDFKFFYVTQNTTIIGVWRTSKMR